MGAYDGGFLCPMATCRECDAERQREQDARCPTKARARGEVVIQSAAHWLLNVVGTGTIGTGFLWLTVNLRSQPWQKCVAFGAADTLLGIGILMVARLVPAAIPKENAASTPEVDRG